MREKIFYILDIILFYIIRIVCILFALLLGYVIIQKIIEPKITEKLCLTNPENCSEIEIYQYENTFIAKEKISQIWFWYNGLYLFVYGEAVGSCTRQSGIEYEPVTVFSMVDIGDGNLEFTQFPNQCIPTWSYILSNYQGQKKSKRQDILLYRKNPKEVNSIFNVIKNMLNNKIFVL